MEMQTPSLRIIPQTREDAYRMVDSMSPSERKELSPDWLARLAASSATDHWLHGFRLLHRASGDEVGNVAFKGPPVEGMVEIAYGIAPEQQGRGFATEAARVLIDFALADKAVAVVRAHTLPGSIASKRVLAKCGMRYVGDVVDPEDGLVCRFEKTAQDGIAKQRMPAIVDFLTDLERLKLVNRKAYVSDLTRRENSAEHSWHLAMGLLTIAHELNVQIDLHKALVMALIHDTCEIDAGDTPAYGAPRPDQHEAELKCVQRLALHEVAFGPTLLALWLEYEAQQTAESRWVKVLDRVMPFIVNLATQGRNWKELSVTRSQVLNVSRAVRDHAPEIYAWMVERIDICVKDGWLVDA